MDVGHDLDVLMAERVMDWYRRRWKNDVGEVGTSWFDRETKLKEMAGYCPPRLYDSVKWGWRPSADWGCAGLVVEKLGFSIWCAGGGGIGWKWAAGYWQGTDNDLICWSYDLPAEECLSPICDTAPHAICLAAKAAMEAK